MDELVRSLGEVEVLTPDGEVVRLGSAWDSRPILLAMIRHFG
jgi:hypothetical protein